MNDIKIYTWREVDLIMKEKQLQEGILNFVVDSWVQDIRDSDPTAESMLPKLVSSLQTLFNKNLLPNFYDNNRKANIDIFLGTDHRAIIEQILSLEDFDESDKDDLITVYKDFVGFIRRKIDLFSTIKLPGDSSRKYISG